jgi:hypothetical protein
MRVGITDPTGARDVTDLEHAPLVVEGHGDDTLEIYFESEASGQAHLEVEVKRPTGDMISAYNRSTGFAIEMSLARRRGSACPGRVAVAGARAPRDDGCGHPR